MKRLFLIILVIFAVLFAAYKLLPAKKISDSLGEDNTVSKTLCSNLIKVSGDSMEPFFKNGEIINFNKCFIISDLTVNTIVAYREGEISKIGVIGEVKELATGTSLQIFRPNRPDEGQRGIAPADILAVYGVKYSVSQ
jgi:signal peptidase I